MKSQKKIIISRLLDSDRAMTAFLFDPPTSQNLREHPDVLVSDSWELTGEQRILVRAALDIWSSSGNVFLWELLNGLTHQNLSRVILALVSWRELKTLNLEFAPTLAELNL